MSTHDFIFDIWQYTIPDQRNTSLAYEHFFECNRIWDSQEARFSPCFLPVIASIPAVVAVAVLACLLTRWMWKKPPRWTQPFVKETIPPADRLDQKIKRPYGAVAIFVIATLGCATELVATFYPSVHLETIFPLIAWVASVVLILILRPRSMSASVLLIHVGLALSQLILILGLRTPPSWKDATHIISLFLAIVAILISLNMPLRDPRLPKTDEISIYLSPPSHLQRSPEDDLTLLQWFTVSWFHPLLYLGGKRQLESEDVWSLAYQFQHNLLHHTFRDLSGTVLRRILLANFLDVFVILPTLALINLAFTFASPLLLQQLLQSLENPASSRQANITYAVLSLIVRLIQAQIGVLNTWYSRRAYERSRGEMITMVTEKTLRRKTVATPVNLEKDLKCVAIPNADLSTNSCEQDSTDHHDESPVNNHPEGNDILEAKSASLMARIGNLWINPFKSKTSNVLHNQPKKQEVKAAATTGKLLSIVRADVYEVAQRFWEIDSLISIPFGLIFSVIVISRLIGFPSCAVGVLTVIFFQATNALLTRFLLNWEQKRRVSTDNRLNSISQLVSAIRHLRWYGWEMHWLDEVLMLRDEELRLRLITGSLRSAISSVNYVASEILPVATFAAYTLLGGKLRVDIAFPALALFQLLQDSLREIPNLITTFLNAAVAMGRVQDFMDEEEISLNQASEVDGELILKNATFSWPGLPDPVLRNVSLSFPTGLTLVFGEVGSGKSALVLALLGEMELRNGDLIRNQSAVSYAAQSPWLQSQTLRENILFGDVWEEQRYNDVIEACELVTDMTDFKYGDLTQIGEGGIGLSGGQKARVALARAIYNRAKYVLLDDPLSALDSTTAENIVRKCFYGPLMKDRTTILITHRTDYFDAKVVAQKIQVSKGNVLVTEEEPTVDQGGNLTLFAQISKEDEDLKKPPQDTDQETFKEHRAYGGVKASVYWEYIKAGRLRLWLGFVVLLAAHRAGSVGKTWFLKSFGEAYGVEIHDILLRIKGLVPDEDPAKNPVPWLLGLLYIALGQSLFYTGTNVCLLFVIMAAGRSMFRATMKRVCYATFRYFETTPSGVLLNRVTGDMGVVDGGNIARLGQSVLFGIFTWISAIAVFSTTSAYFLLVAVGAVLGFVFIFQLFLPCSQSLRRLEVAIPLRNIQLPLMETAQMVSLTPLLSNFGVMIEGLTTIRAFQTEHTFLNRVIVVTDSFQKMDHFYWSLQSWLALRLDTLSASATFMLTLIAILGNFSAGLVAFVLVAASKFVWSTHALCKQYGQLQMEFVSIERVLEIMHVEQEPPGNMKPPAAWPLPTGDITFENVTIRYAPHLDPSLTDLSFTIKGGSNVAIIGRTGSGKSTLVLSLLATILPNPGEGRILIDGIDISKVEKQTLRQRITFLAQDPVLFPGSMHQNLDPLQEHSEQECDEVLQRVGGSFGWTLTTKVETGGRNLSNGQRQMIGLARAILRRSAIVILDEATASIDMETAARIQQLMREELKGSTLITIAHRLEAVRGADYCITLGKGRIISQGLADDLLGSGDATPAGTATPREEQ